MRCVHEASLYKANSFITLTYNDANLPTRGSLNYAHFQQFMRRLRKEIAPRGVRFYMCGEYGPQLSRPHYHACLFGHDWDDKTYWNTTPAGAKLYRSGQLERLWGKGYTTTGDLTFESAAYTARYCMKKITGEEGKTHYKRWDDQGEYELEPEFNHMSLKPGIGKRFLEKWETDIYPNDYVIINGKETKPPKYYDRQLAKHHEQTMEEIKYKREMKGRKQYEDNTERRLKDKEIVTAARAKYLKRGMDEH